MHVLNVTSYGVDKAYDFTPNIPSFYESYQIAAQKMFAVIPRGNDIEEEFCHIHKTDAPSSISDNRFGYTVHESTFHKCWTIGKNEPSIWDAVSTPPDYDFVADCDTYINMMKLSTESATTSLCQRMNETVLHSIVMNLVRRNLIPCNGAILNRIKSLLHLLEILFGDGENDFIEGIHGILMGDNHPCFSRRYHPNSTRLLLAIQVKDTRLTSVTSLKERISEMEQSSISSFIVRFYDSYGDDKEIVFNEEYGTILWSFGYDHPTDIGVNGVGRRPLILRKIKTASLKECRVTFDTDSGLLFNVPTNVALVIPYGKTLEVHLDCIDNNYVFYALEFRTGKSCEQYCIFKKDELESMTVQQGVQIKSIQFGHYVIELTGVSSDVVICAKRRPIAISDMGTYFGIQKDELGMPNIDMVRDVSTQTIFIKFGFRFRNTVRFLDDTRNSFSMYAIPADKYKVQSGMDLSMYQLDPAHTMLSLENIGFGEQSIMMVTANVPKRNFVGETIVFRINFHTGAFIGAGENNIAMINSPFALQFVFRIVNNSLVTESVYEWFPSLPWSPIIPKESLLERVSVSDADKHRGIVLERIDYNQYALVTKDQDSVIDVGIVNRPENEFPYAIKELDNIAWDDNLYFAILTIPVSNRIENIGYQNAISVKDAEAAVVEDITLTNIYVITESRSMPLDLGAECYHVIDVNNDNGCQCESSKLDRKIVYSNLRVRIVKGIMKLPILFGRTDTVTIHIPDLSIKIHISVKLPEPPVIDESDSGEDADQQPGDNNDVGGGDSDTKPIVPPSEETGDITPEKPPLIGEGEDEI